MHWRLPVKVQKDEKLAADWIFSSVSAYSVIQPSTLTALRSVSSWFFANRTA
jgi:hypothetical protein